MTTAPTVSARPRVWSGVAVWLCGGASGFATLWWLVVVLAGPIGPTMIGWLLAPMCCLAAAVLCWQTGRTPDVADAARMFWRRAGTALATFAVSMVSRFADSVNPDLTMTSRITMVSAVAHGVGVIMLVYPLLRLPLGTRSRGSRLALWLDLGTVVLASAVFLWYFVMRNFDVATDTPTAAASVALMVAGLTGVFVVTKVALTGTATLDRRGLMLLAAALATGGLGSAFTPLLDHAGIVYVDTGLIVVPVCVLLIALGARLQAVGGGRGAADRARRRFSTLPYVAVAATDGLLLATVHGGRPADRLIVAIGAVALTVLVVIRQLSAFRENDRLLTRLDAGLLELRRHEQRFRSLVQNSTDVVSIMGPDGRLSYISPAVRAVLGREPEELIGVDNEGLMHPDDLPMMAERLAGIAGTPGGTVTVQMRLRHADATWRWFEMTSANQLHDPAVGGIVNNGRDITESRQFQERLSYEASHDVLTGLANRALFGERIARSVGNPTPGHRMSVILVDLDDFKTVNDTLGHAVGDALLVAVAGWMRDNVRGTDVVARLGGDEFAILLEDLSAAGVEEVVNRITAAMREPVLAEGHVLTVRASFGIVDGGTGDDAGDLLRQADIAMYEAKERGEGSFKRYRPGMEARGAERNRIAAELRTALAEDQLRLHYQPVVTLPAGSLSGVEALIRWQHPDRGLLSPGDFIPAAEATGLIVSVGRWVLREACRQTAAWHARFGDHAPATVSVNVSARQLQDARFAAEVAGALRDSGLPAHRLTIEITESTAVGGGSTAETLGRLRELGVRLSLDDFGTGQSTLSLLAECPVDQIKLDRSFAPVPGPDIIATAVLQLARALGVEAVAEGVETPEQADHLRSLGYEQAQGFHFARPMAPGDIAAAIEARLPQARTTAA
jgi:diguanylate cyclase (GGDEF)-like protein/PAS domain S-box-containing protein